MTFLSHKTKSSRDPYHSQPICHFDGAKKNCIKVFGRTLRTLIFHRKREEHQPVFPSMGERPLPARKSGEQGGEGVEFLHTRVHGAVLRTKAATEQVGQNGRKSNFGRDRDLTQIENKLIDPGIDFEITSIELGKNLIIYYHGPLLRI